MSGVSRVNDIHFILLVVSGATLLCTVTGCSLPEAPALPPSDAPFVLDAGRRPTPLDAGRVRDATTPRDSGRWFEDATVGMDAIVDAGRPRDAPRRPTE